MLSESDVKKDWRFTNQDKYLMKANLIRFSFSSKIRDHDHCEFCWATFGEFAGGLREGYCTLDKYHWICDECYKDFAGFFQWTVTDDTVT